MNLLRTDLSLTLPLPLVADGLCIRAFGNKDASAFAAAVRESITTVGNWLPWCHINYSEAEAQAWFHLCKHNMRCGTAYDFGIFSGDGEELYGGISINQINRQHGIGNVGYWVREKMQRQGIASRAVRAIAQLGFAELELTRLEIVALPDNQKSRGVAEKVGASFEGFARNRLVVNGKAHAGAVYSLIPGQHHCHSAGAKP